MMMSLEDAAQAIRTEIARLERALSILTGDEEAPATRPAFTRSTATAPHKRQISEEAKARIAEAQRRRWEKMRSQQTAQPAAAEQPVIVHVEDLREQPAPEPASVEAKAEQELAEIKAGKKRGKK